MKDNPPPGRIAYASLGALHVMLVVTRHQSLPARCVPLVPEEVASW